MGTFHTFVVPYDFSASADQALTLAADLAAKNHGEIVLAHGMQIPILGTNNPAISVAELVESVRAHVTKRLREVLETKGLQGAVEVRTADPDEWLPAFAAALKNPVIVLSRHGWSGRQEGVGSAAKRILRGAASPVWLCGGPADSPKKVLAAVDVDRGGEKLAQAAKAIARQSGASLELVHVRDPRIETGYLSEVGWPPAVAVFDDLRREAEGALKKLAASLSEGPFKAEARIAVGPPAREIAREAEAIGANLVVVGKHARSRVETFLLGSTTAELARLYSGHLLVIP